MIACLESVSSDIIGLAILTALGFIIWLIKVSIPQIIDKKLASLAGRADLVHRVQFEAEFRSYTDIWSKATKTYRTFIVAFPPPSERFPKTKEKYADFVDAHAEFLNVFFGSKPFLPDEIFEKIMAFDDLMVDAKERGICIESREEVKAN